MYPGSGATLHVVERFTRTADDRMEYTYTIDDPKVYVKPYTVMHILRRDDDREGATSVCQEDPKDRANSLANARADEQSSLDSGEVISGGGAKGAPGRIEEGCGGDSPGTAWREY